MPRLILLTQTLITLLASLLAVEQSRAADPLSPAAAATLMLNKGWAKTKAAQDVVNEQNLNEPPLKDHSLVRAAHWLVLMYQGRYNPALDSVNVFLDKHPTSVDGLRAEVWMDMVGQDYDDAIVAAQKLGEVIAPPQQAGEKAAAATAATDDVIYFLGHVAGFLDGPANKLNDAERRKFETLLLARLSADQKETFQLAKRDVIDQFQTMQEKAGALKQDAQQAADAVKQDKLQKLDDKSAELSQAKAKTEADAKKVADDLQQKMANLTRQDGQLQLQWRRLQNDLASLNNLIQRQEDEVKRLERDAGDPKSPNQQNARNQANSARNQLRDLNSRLNFTNNEIFMVEAAHQRLVEQGLVSQWQGQNAGQQLQAKQEQLNRDMRKAANEQRRAQDAKPKPPVRTASLENESRAFTTYDRFPFDELKAKLLKALK
jgi:hypothetical protein